MREAELDNPQSRLEYLSHTKDEWEEFFNDPKWKKVMVRGQELADALQHRLLSMPVKDLNGVIELLSLRLS